MEADVELQDPRGEVHRWRRWTHGPRDGCVRLLGAAALASREHVHSVAIRANLLGDLSDSR